MRIMKREKQVEEEYGSGNEDEVESTKLFFARMDAWIMTMLHCLGSETNRGGNRQKLYIEKFQSFLHIAMRQITGSLYKFVE